MDNRFQIGEKLPNWHLLKVFDQKVPVPEGFIGKPLIILFFSLTCPGCVGRAIPFANRIVYENGEFVNVLGIHTHFEGPETTDEILKKAKEDFFIRFPYFRDYGFASTFHLFEASGTPHWVIVDENGKVRDSIFGSDPNRALLKIDYLIEELKDKHLTT